MSSLGTYDLPDIVAIEGGNVIPGAWVHHKDDPKSFGMVVARAWDEPTRPMQVSVVWTREPKLPFSSIAFPIVRRVFNPLIAQQLVSVQPMTAPAGSIFYLDYKYGSGSKGEDVEEK
jgi:hypothetical protein